MLQNEFPLHSWLEQVTDLLRGNVAVMLVHNLLGGGFKE